MTRRRIIIIAVFAVFGTPLIIIGSLFLFARHHFGTIDAPLLDPAAYEPAGPALARLCQSDPDFFEKHDEYFPAWLPGGISRIGPMGPEMADLHPNGGTITFGGGFYHDGYLLELDAAANDASRNHWIFSFWSEGSGCKRLSDFYLAKADRIRREQFIHDAVTEYDRRIRLRLPGGDSIDRAQFLKDFNVPRADQPATISATERN